MFIMKGFQLEIKFGLKEGIQAVCLICLDGEINKCKTPKANYSVRNQIRGSKISHIF